MADVAGLGAEVLAVPGDVTQEDEVEAMVAAVLERFRAARCAGQQRRACTQAAKSWEMSEAQWDRVLDVDLKGPFLCSKHAARHMIDRRGREGS